MRVSDVVLLLVCIKGFLGFPLSSAIRAKGGMWGSYRGTTSDPSADLVLPATGGWHRRGSKVGESTNPSVKLASSTHNVTYVATNVSPGGDTATGTHSKSGSRLSHDSKVRFAGVGENGLCYLADGHERGMKHIADSTAFSSLAIADGNERGMKHIAGSIKYIAGSIAFSSLAICIAFRK
jgi:hypothetical protein